MGGDRGCAGGGGREVGGEKEREEIQKLYSKARVP